MGRGANATQSSRILYGSPFQSRPRLHLHTPADPVAVAKVRADELIEKLFAELEADPIDPRMDPINIRMCEDTRKMKVGILKVAATDPEAWWDARELKDRARVEYGEDNLGSHAPNFGQNELVDAGYLEHGDGALLRLVL